MPLPPLPEPKSISARAIGFFKGALAAGVLFPLLIVINLLQTLSILIKPLSPGLFRKFNRGCANFWWGVSYLWGERLYGIQVEITGDSIPMRENAMLVCNHQEMPDIPVLFKLAYEKERLGDLKWFVKDILKYVPGVGWGMLFLDCLFVKRNWTDDKAYIEGVFAKIIREKIPVWIISFVEGTRVKPKKLEKSNEYATKQGLKPTRHVLLPRTKGFTTTVLSLQTHLDAVYDITIGYIDGVPTIWQWFKGYSQKAYVHVKRFPVSELPSSEEELSDWLLERFYLKDEILEQYYQTGTLTDLDSTSRLT